MPKVPETKEKITLSLDKNTVYFLKKKAKQNGRKISQEAEKILGTVLESDKAYLEYELKRVSGYLNVLKFKALNHNTEKEIKRMIK